MNVGCLGKNSTPKEDSANCCRGGSMLGMFQERQRDQCDPGNGSLAGNHQTQSTEDSQEVVGARGESGEWGEAAGSNRVT